MIPTIEFLLPNTSATPEEFLDSFIDPDSPANVNISCIALNSKSDIYLRLFDNNDSSPIDSVQVYNEKKICNMKYKLCSPIIQATVKFEYDLIEEVLTKHIVCSANSFNPDVKLYVEKNLFITRRKNQSK